MTDVLTAEAGTDAVTKGNPAQQDVNGVGAEFVAQLLDQAPGEGAKHWLHVLTELKNRGVADVLEYGPLPVRERPALRQVCTGRPRFSRSVVCS